MSLGEKLCMSGALVSIAAAQKTCFDHLVLVAGGGGVGREACISGSRGTVVLGKMVLGRLPPPGPCTDSGLRYPFPPATHHHPRLSVKEAFCPAASA